MGQYLSRAVAGRDPRDGESESGGTSALTYRYPPKNGAPYFANHFIMGGEKFDQPQPESFLFGENSDLNNLGSRAVSFPYPPPPPNEGTKTLKSQINIRRDSLHFVTLKSRKDTAATSPESEGGGTNLPGSTDTPPTPPRPEEKGYHVEFTFDADVRSAITIQYFCIEEVTSGGVSYMSRRKDLSSETYEYERGAAQVFSQPDHVFYPYLCQSEIEVASNDPELFSIVIQCVSLEGDHPRQSHATLGLIDKYSDSSVTIKGIKQKLFIDGLSYLLQEIYGLENKTVETSQFSEDDVDDCGAECVVCMCDLRDTIILPCRHLCLCNACADSLRYQANNCPICRAPFRALLQIRAVQKIGQVTHPALPDPETSTEGIPPGYQCVSLVEALNGPLAPARQEPAPQPPKEKKRKSRSAGAKKSGHRSSSGRAAAPDSSSATATATPPAAEDGPAPRFVRVSGATAVIPPFERVPKADPEEVDDEALDMPSGGGSCESPSSSHPLSASRRNISLSIVSEVGSSSPVLARSISSKKSGVTTPNSPSRSGSLNVPFKDSPALSVDLVDEELAKMSANPSITAVGPSPPPYGGPSPPPYDEDDAPAAIGIEDAEEPEVVAEEDDNLIRDEDDEAVVVNLSSVASRVSIPGTPTSNMSARSSQDSSASSSASTNQLLPQVTASGAPAPRTSSAPVPVIVKVTASGSHQSLRGVLDAEQTGGENEC